MRKQRLLVVSFASVATLLLAFAYARPHQHLSYRGEGVQIEGRRCPLLSTLSRAFRCGWLITDPESSERVALAVVRLGETSGARTGTIVLNGGPGDPTLMGASTYLFWSEWGRRLGLVGDLIVFDYRGTGESRPLLGCGSHRPTPAAGWDQPSNRAREAEDAISTVRECAAHALSVGQKLEHLSTERNAKDAAAMLATMGYESWSLYAASYGTTVAERLLVTEARHISKVILDSPPELRRPAELMVLAWASAPALLDEVCNHLGECDEGNSSDFRRALNRLRREPHRFDSTSIRAQLIVDDYRFFWAVVDALSDRHTRTQLPWIVGAAAEGDYGGMETLVEVFLETERAVNSNDLVFWATECNDFGAFDRAAFQQLLDEHPIAQPYISELVCPLGLEGGAQLAVTSPAPGSADVLVLAARFDPVSTVSAARDVADRLKATLVVSDEASHGVVFFDDDPCLLSIVAEFNRHGRIAAEPEGICAGSVELVQRP